MERVLVEGYDLTNARVSGGTGCVSGTGTVRGWFLGITLRWGNGYCLFLGRSFTCIACWIDSLCLPRWYTKQSTHAGNLCIIQGSITADALLKGSSGMISAAVAMLTRTPLRRAHLYKGLSRRTFGYHFLPHKHLSIAP